MPRVRSRRALEARVDWPDAPEREYALGPFPLRYRSRLAAFFARHARGPEDVVRARDIEARWRRGGR